MVVFKTVIDFFKKNPKFLEYGIIAIIIYFLAVVPIKNKLNEERADRERFEKTVLNNIDAMQDSVRIAVDENGKVFSEKLGYTVRSIDELKQYDEKLFEELQNNEKNLKSYINSEVEAVLDKVGESSGNLKRTSDSTFNLTTTYNYADSGMVHDFESITPLYITNLENKLDLNKGTTQILKNRFNISLDYRTMYDEETGKTKVVARSLSQLVKFNDLNTVFIDDKKVEQSNSRFGVGPSIGIGYSSNGFSPYFGIGINWNVITIKKN